MTVFVDTSAFYAGLDQDDINHTRAKNAWTNLLAGDARLLTSNYVLLETSALVQKRLGPAALRLLCQDFVPLVAVVFGSWYLLPSAAALMVGVAATMASGIYSLRTLCRLLPLERLPQAAQKVIRLLRLTPSTTQAQC